MAKIFEVFVEKKKGFNTEAVNLLSDINRGLNKDFASLRILNRYLVEGLSEEDFKDSIYKVFAEKNVDDAYLSPEEAKLSKNHIVTELLPGQFDIRANAAVECLLLIYEAHGLKVKYSKVIIFDRELTDKEKNEIEKMIINPVDSRSTKLHYSFDEEDKNDSMPKIYNGFRDFTDENLSDFHKKLSLAMTVEDLKVIREYFKEENRDPNETEIKVLDTYWSDHCRHTTFMTELTDVNFSPEAEMEKSAYQRYLNLRKDLSREHKPVTLMDMATIAARYLKKTGIANDIDESDEINACSIIREIRTNEGIEKYLIEFKNETHNHPTEIEPFGGAATCLGGAIRDPLSGRAFVYQAMRITGASDPTERREDTLFGKLPQRDIVTTAAKGYSSYGNQIGLATGTVREIYHEGYKAKRMEVGAVIGSAPLYQVRRLKPEENDIVILLGGRTGRDGVGGATGSSKSHDTESIITMGAEVQKGNAPTERKIQRLMRDNRARYLIRKCNDFGAGGVCVAIGELADGVNIDLDKVPVKYDGLTATETAVSESQERLAVVINQADLDEFMSILDRENLEGTVVAKVTKEARLVMNWRGNKVVDINRSFLDSAGARAFQTVFVTKNKDREVSTLEKENFIYEKCVSNDKEDILKMYRSLNSQSQRALNENFDSSNGAATLAMPYGGKYQDTESSYMAALIALDKGVSRDASVMTFGFNPYLSEKDQYLGAYMAVVESVAKMAVSGADIENIRLSFQEYFEKLKDDPNKWGKPMKSLLGALDAQLDYKIPAIGGKDSMSGSFNEIHVPPTLISFAVNTVENEKLIINTLKGDSELYLLKTDRKDGKTDIDSFKKNVKEIQRLRDENSLLSADTTWRNLYMTLTNMALGNRIGFKIDSNLRNENFPVMVSMPDSFIVEVKRGTKVSGIKIGETTDDNFMDFNSVVIDFIEAKNTLEERLGKVFNLCKDKADSENDRKENEMFPKISKITYNERPNLSSKVKIKKPKVLITVFPGNNCEYDLERAISEAGGDVTTYVLRNRDREDFKKSIDELSTLISQTNIIMIPGGFSAGDEPEGSGKFIANVFRNEKIKKEVTNLLSERDGLMLGICNGFQALIKLGLVPYGKIIEPNENMPTLSYNTIGKHMDAMSRVRVASVNSPWLKYVNCGEAYSVPISHGEGRFIAQKDELEKLIKSGQIITQYCDLDNNATYEAPFNPNGSMMAVEGLVSPDGRILGKMGHNERWCKNLYRNYVDEFDMKLFKAGIEYFTGK